MKLIDVRSAIAGAGLVAIVFGLASFQERMTYRTPEGKAGPAPFIVRGTVLDSFRFYGETEPKTAKSLNENYMGFWKVVAAPGGSWVEVQTLFVHAGDLSDRMRLGYSWVDWSKVVEYEISADIYQEPDEEGEGEGDEDGR